MKMYIYETESIACDGGGVEIVIVVAESRKDADQAMLDDPNCWVSDQSHLDNVYKVEEKTLASRAVMFRANVLERLDPHGYNP